MGGTHSVGAKRHKYVFQKKKIKGLSLLGDPTYHRHGSVHMVNSELLPDEDSTQSLPVESDELPAFVRGSNLRASKSLQDIEIAAANLSIPPPAIVFRSHGEDGRVSNHTRQRLHSKEDRNSFPTAIPADRLMQNDINAGHARSSDPLSDKFSQITVNGNVAQNPARRLSNILITNRETKEKCEVIVLGTEPGETICDDMLYIDAAPQSKHSQTNALLLQDQNYSQIRKYKTDNGDRLHKRDDVIGDNSNFVNESREQEINGLKLFEDLNDSLHDDIIEGSNDVTNVSLISSDSSSTPPSIQLIGNNDLKQPFELNIYTLEPSISDKPKRNSDTVLIGPSTDVYSSAIAVLDGDNTNRLNSQNIDMVSLFENREHARLSDNTENASLFMDTSDDSGAIASMVEFNKADRNYGEEIFAYLDEVTNYAKVNRNKNSSAQESMYINNLSGSVSNKTQEHQPLELKIDESRLISADNDITDEDDDDAFPKIPILKSKSLIDGSDLNAGTAAGTNPDDSVTPDVVRRHPVQMTLSEPPVGGCRLRTRHSVPVISGSNFGVVARPRVKRRSTNEPPPLPPRTGVQDVMVDNAGGNTTESSNALTDVRPLSARPARPHLPIRPYSITTAGDGSIVQPASLATLKPTMTRPFSVMSPSSYAAASASTSASTSASSASTSASAASTATSAAASTYATADVKLPLAPKKWKANLKPMKRIKAMSDEYAFVFPPKKTAMISGLDLKTAIVESGPKLPPRRRVKSEIVTSQKKKIVPRRALPSTPLGPHEEASPTEEQVRNQVWKSDYDSEDESDFMCLLDVPLRVDGKVIDSNALLAKHTRDLFIAAQSGRTDYVRTLLNQTNVDVNVGDSDEWTPLHHACKSANPATVSLLLDRGAYINSRTKYGSEPLLIALLEKHKEDTMRKWHQRDVAQIVHMLVFRGANVNLVDPSGLSTLLVAVSVENNYTTDYLLDNGAAVNFPLHLRSLLHAVTLQVSRGLVWLEIERKLLERGANPNHEDCSGNVPASLLFYSEFSQFKQDDILIYNQDDNQDHGKAEQWEKYIELPLVLRLAKPNLNTFGYTKKRLARFLRHMRAGLKISKIQPEIMLTIDRILSQEQNLDVLELFHCCGHSPNTALLRSQEHQMNEETLQELETNLNTPAGLIHLAANAIRTNIYPNAHINADKLPIPNILKQFITLDAYKGIEFENFTVLT